MVQAQHEGCAVRLCALCACAVCCRVYRAGLRYGGRWRVRACSQTHVTRTLRTTGKLEQGARHHAPVVIINLPALPPNYTSQSQSHVFPDSDSSDSHSHSAQAPTPHIYASPAPAPPTMPSTYCYSSLFRCCFRTNRAGALFEQLARELEKLHIHGIDLLDLFNKVSAKI